MIFKEMKDSSALGAKTARACDSCLRIRARWFCAADDAFLCHGCDNLVHSANQLASRHERVRLQTSASSSNNNKVITRSSTTQVWHSGFTRKARTPRVHNNNKNFLVQQQQSKDHEDEEEEEQEVLFSSNNSALLPLVPELGSEELLLDDETHHDEEHMLCRVPVFDPFDSGLCSLYNEVKDEILFDTNNSMKKNDDVVVVGGGGAYDDEEDEELAFDLDKFSELLPSDMDLAEFAADVESLLELDEDSVVDVKGSSSKMVACKEEDDETDVVLGAKGAVVKVKDEELDGDMACNLDSLLDMNDEAFDWSIESESMVVATQEEEEKVPVVASGKERLLRLNYEEVIAAWASQGSPWTTGIPPKFNTDDHWPDYLGSSGADVQCSYGGVRTLVGSTIADGGREARVSRYREKRRTRLFAKKIRYEVRKLNAEKRPRMKGRFVKRTSFVGGNTAFPAQLPLTSK